MPFFIVELTHPPSLRESREGSKKLEKTQKRAAVAVQKAIDLREALAKAENQARMLEEKMDGFCQT